jgi:hypothetical protein
MLVYRVMCRGRRLLLAGLAAVCPLIFGAACVLLGAVPAVVRAQGLTTIGNIRITRAVLVSRDPITSGALPTYLPAKEDQGIFGGQGVRTLKRAQAEVRFRNDQSLLRISERTDVILQDAATLRRIQLKAGLVWVRVAKGVNTQVETPAATAVARGTEFTVEQTPSGSTRLTVYEGTVEIQVGERTVPVHAGETIEVIPDGKTPPGYTLPDAATPLRREQIPIEYGGAFSGWWHEIEDGAGVAVTTGTNALLDLRSSTVGEAIQQLKVAQNLGKPADSSHVIPDPGEKQSLLDIVHSTLIPDFKSSGLTLSQYEQQFGNQPVDSHYNTLSPSDVTFLGSVGVTTVGDLVDSALVNGAGANVSVDLSRRRTYYKPESIRGQQNFDLRLLDRTDSSTAIFAVGAAAALIADVASGGKLEAFMPKYEVSGFGILADPDSLVGGRARLDGRIGKTNYAFEANVLSLLTGDNKGTFSKLFSVAVVDQQVAPGVTIFAGRRRFYHGPVFQNQNLSQLIAERYSGAGVTVTKGAFGFDGAWVYDSNPDVGGEQSGALGSLFYKAAGGLFGLHYIHVGDLDSGNGVTVSGSYPVLQNHLDVYAEVGKGPDKATLQTYGLYFPGFFQKTDVDAFIEYGSHPGIGRSLSFIGTRDVGKYWNFRGYVDLADSGNDVSGGVAALFRFGN